MPGLVFVVTIYTFPYVYIMIANTLALIASDLEEAAAILGAGRFTVALTVTLPMVAPALVSGFILSVLQALALFGSPAILALPAGFHTITTQIWSFFQFPPKIEMAAAFSIPLLLATALLLLVQKRLLGPARLRGRRRQGRAAADDPARARGAGRRSPACLAVMACAIFLPYGILAKAAFSRAWAQPLTWEQPHARQLHVHVLRVQRDPGGDREHARAGRRSRPPSAPVLVALLVLRHQPPARRSATRSWPSSRWRRWSSRAWCWPSRCSSPTRGRRSCSTARCAILFVAYLTKEMPVGYAQSDATFRGIPPELEDAGRILGAGRLRVLRDVTAPLARSGIIAAWCFIFIGVIRELSASIILFTPDHQGDVGGDLRPQGGGPVRRHRRAGPRDARADVRHGRARAGACSAATCSACGSERRCPA